MTTIMEDDEEAKCNNTSITVQSISIHEIKRNKYGKTKGSSSTTATSIAATTRSGGGGGGDNFVTEMNDCNSSIHNNDDNDNSIHDNNIHDNSINEYIHNSNSNSNSSNNKKQGTTFSRGALANSIYHDNQDGDADGSTNDKRINFIRQLCGYIVENTYFNLFFVALIIVSSISIGLATFDVINKYPERMEILDTLDLSLLCLFTIEITLQLLYRGYAQFFRDAWMTFDLIIIIFSWLVDGLQVLRAFMVLRAIRVMRAFLLISRLQLLRDLVQSIISVLPNLYSILCLQLLVMYVFSVLFTESFGELELSDDYFTSLHISFFTCVEMMTLEWADTTREVMQHEPWAWGPFLVYLILSHFIFYNLITAVVCDAVAVQEERCGRIEGKAELKLKIERNKQFTTKLLKNLHKIRKKSDTALTMLKEVARGVDEGMNNNTSSVDDDTGDGDINHINSFEDLVDRLRKTKKKNKNDNNITTHDNNLASNSDAIQSDNDALQESADDKEDPYALSYINKWSSDFVHKTLPKAFSILKGEVERDVQQQQQLDEPDSFYDCDGDSNILQNGSDYSYSRGSVGSTHYHDAMSRLRDNDTNSIDQARANNYIYWASKRSVQGKIESALSRSTREIKRSLSTLQLKSILRNPSPRTPIVTEEIITVPTFPERRRQSRMSRQSHISIKSVEDTIYHRIQDARKKAGRFVNSILIQRTVALMILANAICLGISTFDFVAEDSQIIFIFQRIDKTLLILFTIEILLHLFYHGCCGPNAFYKDGFVLFDFIIITFSWLYEAFRVLRTIAILRAFRLIRAFRLVSHVGILRDLVSAISQVIPRLTGIACFLTILFYIFSVLLMNLYENPYIVNMNFNTTANISYATEFDFNDTGTLYSNIGVVNNDAYNNTTADPLMLNDIFTIVNTTSQESSSFEAINYSVGKEIAKGNKFANILNIADTANGTIFANGTTATNTVSNFSTTSAEDILETEDGEVPYWYFQSLGMSLFTCSQLMSLDEWADVTREIMSLHHFAWVPILIFIVLSQFIFFNLVIAVISYAVIENDFVDENENIEDDQREDDDISASAFSYHFASDLAQIFFNHNRPNPSVASLNETSSYFTAGLNVLPSLYQNRGTRRRALSRSQLNAIVRQEEKEIRILAKRVKEFLDNQKTIIQQLQDVILLIEQKQIQDDEEKEKKKKKKRILKKGKKWISKLRNKKLRRNSTV